MMSTRETGGDYRGGLVALQSFLKTARSGKNLIILAFSVILFASMAQDAGASGRLLPNSPNIILILTDDLDAASVDSLPNILSLLAEQGISFSNCFVSVSVCVPSRVSTLLGQTAHNHQVYTNLPPDGGFRKFNESGQENSTIATWLQDAGYRTGFFGKYLNGYPDANNQSYVPPGWTEWNGVIKRYFDYRINENGKIVQYGTDPADYETDVLSNKVCDFIRQNPPGQPFFVYLAPNAPHRPATPAPRHLNSFATATAPQHESFNESDISDKPDWLQELRLLSGNQIGRVNDLYRARLQTMLSVDEMVRSIIDTLSVMNQLENTYIFFTSDHGFHQGEHRIQQGKQTPYEEAIRVPFFVRGPGIPTGEVVDYLTSNIDIAPTFLDLAGASEQSDIDGKSLLPLMGTGPLPGQWRSCVLVEHWDQSSFSAVPVAIPEYQAIRTSNNLYVEYVTGERECYDMNADLYQIASDSTLADSGMVSLLEQMRTCMGSDCFPATAVAGSSLQYTPELSVESEEAPFHYDLGQNYPNPFNPDTKIGFQIVKRGLVTLELFDLLGRNVATLVRQELAPGSYTRDVNGSNLSAGTYLYRLSTDGFVETKKLILLK